MNHKVKKKRKSVHMYIYYAHMNMMYVNLGDNCIVFKYFTASIGDLMVANEFTGNALAESVNRYL